MQKIVTENDFFSKNYGKIVHVDFFEFDKSIGGMAKEFFEGTLKGIQCDNEDDEEPTEELVVIENDTDYVQIPKKDIKRIYLKEKKEDN